MKEIQLTKGYVTIVDDDDFDALSKFKWHVKEQRQDYIRALRMLRITGGRRKTIYIHQCILTAPAGMVVDHIDGNPLNNQKSNLRICTRAENCWNKRRAKNNTSGFRGVTRKGDLFHARIMVKRRSISAGTFKTPEQAARSYDRAAIIHHGEFARLNFPQ